MQYPFKIIEQQSLEISLFQLSHLFKKSVHNVLFAEVSSFT